MLCGGKMQSPMEATQSGSRFEMKTNLYYNEIRWGYDGVVVSAGRCFRVRLVSSLLCCFLIQESLLHIVFLRPSVQKVQVTYC